MVSLSCTCTTLVVEVKQKCEAKLKRLSIGNCGLEDGLGCTMKLPSYGLVRVGPR
jgi:hypothetical protein